MCLKYCRMNGKQYRLWSDATFCSICSGYSLFAQACLFQYLVLLWYITNTYKLLSIPEILAAVWCKFSNLLNYLYHNKISNIIYRKASVTQTSFPRHQIGLHFTSENIWKYHQFVVSWVVNFKSYISSEHIDRFIWNLHWSFSLILARLNKLRCHALFKFSANQITWSRFLL